MSIDVLVCAHILKSHSTVLSLLCPLMLYNKTKQNTEGLEHLNKRWDLQLIIRKVTFAVLAQWCHADQWKYFYLIMWFSFLLFSKWKDLDVIAVVSNIYCRTGFAQGNVVLSHIPCLGPCIIRRALCPGSPWFFLILLPPWKTLFFQENCSYS